MRKELYIILLLSLGLVAAFSEPVILSLDDTLARVGAHELVRQSGIMLDIRTEELSLASGWKGAQLSIAPTMQYGDDTGTFLVSNAGLGLDVVFPLGISQPELERKLAAAELVAIAALDLQDTTGKAYAELFRLYGASYAAQENITVAEKEAELARIRMESVRQKVSRGIAGVSEQADAEYVYQAATEKVIQARLESRLAWFSLASAAGYVIDKPGQGTPAAEHTVSTDTGMVELPRFSPPSIDGLDGMEPLPGVLIARARDASPIIQLQMQKLASAGRSIDDYSPLDLNITPKLAVSLPAASASIAYGTASGSLVLGTDWTPYTNPEKTSAPGTSFTFSVSLNGAVNPQTAVDKAILDAQVRLEERKLQALLQNIELSVRSKYAAWLKARDSLLEAERSNRLSVELSEALSARRTLGQLSPEDEIANEVVLVRSAFSLEKARIAVGQAYLDLMAAASALDPAEIHLNGARK